MYILIILLIAVILQNTIFKMCMFYSSVSLNENNMYIMHNANI
jgi:hypothetical protein